MVLSARRGLKRRAEEAGKASAVATDAQRAAGDAAVRHLQAACRQRPLDVQKTKAAVKEIVSQTRWLTSTDCAFALQALAKLDPAIAADAEDALRERLTTAFQELDARAVAVALWALGTRTEAPGSLIALLQQRLVDISNMLKPVDVSNVVWGLAKLRATPLPEGWEALAARAHTVAWDMKPHELSITIWAAATLGAVVPDWLLAEWQRVLAERAWMFNAQSVANTLWALSKLFTCPENSGELLGSAVDALVQQAGKLYDWNPQGLANSLAACAALKVHPKEIAKLADWVDISSLNGMDVGEMAWALGESRLEAQLDGVLKRAHILAKAGELDWQAVGRLSHALDAVDSSEQARKKTRKVLADCASNALAEVNGARGDMHTGASELLLTMADGPLALPSGSRVLVVDDFQRTVAKALKAKNLRRASWNRFANGQRLSSAWPVTSSAEPSFSAATVRLAATKAATELAVHAVLPLLKPDAPLWIYGVNAEGARTAVDLLRAAPGVAGQEVAAVRDGCTVAYAFRNDEPVPAGALEDWATATELELPSGALRLPWRVYPGLFAGGLLDVMTALLLQVLPAPAPKARILDFCCGSGSIAAALRARTPSVRLTLLDADAIALEAARENVKDARFWLSDAWSSAKHGARFDWIVSNPPVHCGLQPDFTVLCALLEGAVGRLRPSGTLFFVCQAYVPVGLMSMSGSRPLRIISDGRFCVWKVTAVEEAPSQ